MGGLMLNHIRNIVFVILVMNFSLYADYNAGKKIFKQKCSSCHGGYIDGKALENNFLQKDNKVLKLTSPTVNMITYFLKEDANHIGDRDDPEMQRLEIQEYVKDYLYNPNRENSIIREEFLKYFDKKDSMQGKISEDEISNIVDYLFEYEEKRDKKQDIKKFKSVNIDDILKEAKKEKKLVMIEAISKTCYYCEKMEREVLSKSDIKSAIHKDFVYMKVDIDRETLPLDLQKYYKKITPSFFVLDADGKVLNSYPGSWTKEDFFEIMRENIK